MPDSSAGAHHFLSGGGEMGTLIRATDWSRTAFGPVESWPQSLRSAVSILLPSKAQIALFWGDDLVTLYNDAYRPVFGAKHPHALGQPIRESWQELWRAGLEELFDGVRGTGEAFWAQDRPFFMERHGYLEETFFDVSYDPVRDESGRVGGVFCIVSETTGRVVGERRLRTLRELARVAEQASTVDEAWQRCGEVLAASADDLPFALLYARDGDGARLLQAAGLPEGSALASQRVSSESPAWPLGNAACDVPSSHLEALGPLQAGPWPERIREAMVLPIGAEGASDAGWLVAAASPRRRLDADYRDFLQLVAASIAGAINVLRKAEDDRRRAQMLAELDRAKTEFFGNVSHEFRTPLTLMLGPVEDTLADSSLPAPLRERLELVRRNGLRLQKLVNTLLDYSRVEAGRARATFAPTDLAALTRELASAFRSAAQTAGLRLRVECPQSRSPAWVDVEMYEKIVLNLLSNAFKHTFEGEVTVLLQEHETAFELQVSDTGVGIPESEQAHVFERFHRVHGARSRSHEGTGIGLSLVRELVRLHGGDIRLSSRERAGSTFTVTIPTGHAHLPVDQLAAQEPAARIDARAFIEEVTRVVQAEPAPRPAASAGKARPRIVWADDNADMRAYVTRLLEGEYDVHAVPDGEAALASIRADGADLVLTDVMMPKMDGIQLVQALRAEAATRAIPVIVLSARAGEESRIQGHVAGADDYLFKPFSARELKARVRSRLELRAVQRELDQQRQDLSALFAETPVGIAVLRGEELTFEFANPTYRALVAGRDVVGRPLLEALPEIAGQRLDQHMRGVMSSGKPFVGREMAVKVEGGEDGATHRFFTFIYAPLRDGRGRVDRVVVLCSDVTEQVLARTRKDEFLATLAHELRNPLAPMRNGLQLLRMPMLPAPDAERVHDVLDRQLAHLVRLVDDLMEMSRISRGALELRRAPVELGTVVRNAVETSQPLIQARRHALDISLPNGPVWLDGDAVRLSQILSNLLNNAAKYTPEGGRIAVAVETGNGEARISVSDNGIGLSEDDMPRIFEMFTRAGPSNRRDQSGLGIGLALAQRLAHMHGGRIEAASDGSDRGSRFTLKMPLGAAPRAERPAEAAVPSAVTGLRILVVDDNADAAETLRLLLAHGGAEVRVAGDGVQALQAIEEFQPAVVLLDIGMPDMDGYEVARRVRKRPGRQPVLVALTGWGQESDRHKAQQAGFDHHFTKPVDFAALQEFARGIPRPVSESALPA